MEFRILGPIEVVDGETSVRLGGRRQRAVLVALLLRRRHAVPVDVLVEEVWDGTAPPTAVPTLRTYVSNLRRVLGAGVVVTSGPGYLLSVEDRCVDAACFEAGVDEGRSALDRGEPARASAVLAEALARWRGPALADFAYESFAVGVARRLEESRLAAVELRTDAELALGHHRMLVGELEALLAEYPLREQMWSQLMLALYRSGHQADALRAYQRLRAILADEVGVSPTAALVSLEQRLLAQDPSLSWQPSSSAPPAPPDAPRSSDAPVTGGAGRREMPRLLRDALRRGRLVGRDDEFGLCQSSWRAAIEGRPHLLLLTGPPGIGKTRLAAELAHHALSEGASVLLGRCDDAWLAPSAPFLEALRCVGGFDPTPATDADEPTLRFQFFSAVVDELARRAGDGPVLLVLDDVHDADPSTLLLLRHVLRHLPECPLLICATARADEASAQGLLGVIADLRREHAVEEVRLPGLAAAPLGDLVAGLGETMMGGRSRPSATMVEDVVSLAAGNPLYAHEVVRHLADAGRLAPSAEPARVTLSDVPAEVHAIVARRLGRLSPTSLEAVCAAAVLSGSFDPQLLAEVAASDEDVVLDSIDEAVAAGILSPAEEGRFEFSHALVRETAYRQLPPPDRRATHLRVAVVLERRAEHDTVPAAAVARHFALAGRTASDRQRSLPWLVRAGDEAMAALAYEQALDWYGQALAAAERAGEPALGPDVLRLRLALGHALLGAGDWEGARETFRTAARAAHTAGDAAVMAEAALGFGGQWVGASGDDPRLEGLLDGALAALGRGDTALRSRLLARRAAARIFAAGALSGAQLAEEAVEVAERSGDASALAAALHVRGLVLWSPADAPRRLALAEQALQLAEGAGDIERALIARWDRVVDLYELDRLHEGDLALDDYRAASVRAHRPVDQWWTAVISAARAVSLGRLLDGESLAADALSAGIELQRDDAWQVYAAQLFALRWVQGRLAELRVDVERAVGDHVGVTAWRCGLAVLYAESGETALASRLLDELGEHRFADLPTGRLRIAGLALAAHAAALTDRSDIAGIVRAELAPFAGAHVVLGPGVALLGPVDRYIAELDRAWPRGARS